MRCGTSVKTARDAFAGCALEAGCGPVDEGAGLSCLRLRSAAEAELGAQSQELGLGGLFGRNQPVNRDRHQRSEDTYYMCSDVHYVFLSKSSSRDLLLTSDVTEKTTDSR